MSFRISCICVIAITFLTGYTHVFDKDILVNSNLNSKTSQADAVKEQEKNIALAHKKTVFFFQNKNYAESSQWAQRYFKEGGGDIQIRRILSQSYFFNSDFVNAARELQAEMLFSERNGRVLEEDRFQLLLKCYASLNDNNAQAWILEKMVSSYPKKTYWTSLLTLTQRRPDFRKNLSLDVQRLRLVTGALSEPLDYFEMAQNALNQGFGFEAKLVLDHGIGHKILSQSLESTVYLQLRSEINRKIEDEKKMLSKAESELPTSANALSLMNFGLTLVQIGEADRGLVLMEKAISRVGPTERPQDARLHLGIAYLKAGKKTKALDVFSSVSGVHGSADLARLWATYAKNETP
jgi:hypothetical protein